MRADGLALCGLLLMMSACGSSDSDEDDGDGSSNGASGSDSNASGTHGGLFPGVGGAGSSGAGSGGAGHGGTNSGGQGHSGTAGDGPFDQPDGGECDDDCLSQCICAGGDTTECTTACAEGNDAACTADDDCASCESDWGSCVCQNPATIENCFYESSIGHCPGDPGDCSTCGTNYDLCLCQGNSAEACFESFNGTGSWASACSANECFSCSCENCPVHELLCDAGCGEILSCVLTNSCTQVSCAECADTVTTYGGIAGVSAGLAEALLGCRYDSGCASCQ